VILPQTNARLLAITGPGSSEDFDRDAGTNGPVKWHGSSDAYYNEKIRVSLSATPGSITRAKDITLSIPGDLRPSVQIHSGDTVTFLYQGQTLSGKVQDYTNPVPPQWMTAYRVVTLNLEEVDL
jgi:hypothetical protein